MVKMMMFMMTVIIGESSDINKYFLVLLMILKEKEKCDLQVDGRDEPLSLIPRLLRTSLMRTEGMTRQGMRGKGMRRGGERNGW